VSGGELNASLAAFRFAPGSSPLSDGVVGFLTRRCGGNVHERQCIRVFADSEYSGCYRVQNAADLSTDNFFCSANAPNQSLGYDFKDHQSISPTHYAIRSIGWGVNSWHPKSWVIEVTNDRSNENSWVEIDRRENNCELNGSGIVRVFSISHPQSGGFRFIRLRQTGTNHRGDHYLGFAAFELFGEFRIRTAPPG
jgi:hypothetical protein